MLRRLALHFSQIIGLACALGASPAHAGFADLTTLYSQVQLLLNNFIALEKAGGATAQQFLKLDDVKGSSTNANYKNQIPVLFSQNFAATFVSTSGGGVGKASPSDYYLVIPVDQSGPVLEQAAASGKPFQKAIISFLHTAQGQLTTYGTDTLTDVRITFYMKTSTPVTQYPEIAIIGLSFSMAEWAFGSLKACYDFARNTAC